MDGLCRAVAAHSFRGMLAGPLILLIWCRLRRIEAELQRVAARWRAGFVERRILNRKNGMRVGGRVGRAVLPLRFGWLLALVPCDAACFAGQIRTVLGEPEMVALLAASPRARRVLAPLCRMLGVEAGVLTPGAVVPVPVVSGAGAVVVKRVRAVRPPVDFGRIPLPRGVLVAARRQGFGKRV